MTIPKVGLWGAALREAAAGSLQDVLQMIEKKLRKGRLPDATRDFVAALFPDQVVIYRDGEMWRYDWRPVGDTDVELSNPVRVVETFRPADGAMTEAAAGGFLEATGDGGLRWRIRVIRAGLSGNGNYYPDNVLREAAGAFAGARVFVKSDAEHLRGAGKDVRNLIGRLVAPEFVEGDGADAGEIQATLEVLQSAGDVAARLREAWDRKMTDIFGFSIDVKGEARAGRIGGRQVRIATAFKEVKSVDLIVEPGAGGQVIDLIEARAEDTVENDDMKLRERMIAFIEATRPDLAETLDKDDDDAVEAAYREAVAAEATPEPAPEEGDAIGRDEVAAMIRLTEARAAARGVIADSGLPARARERLTARFAEAAEFSSEDVTAAIADERDYLAQVAGGGQVRGLGNPARVELIEGRDEKVGDMLDAFFDPQNREVISFKECYAEITGDARVTGDLRSCDQARLREALGSGDFASVLGDSIRRRMVAEYALPSVYDVWRQVAATVAVPDFRTNERTRFGGYGDLPTVAEGTPYAALTSPTDEKASYAIAKRGGTEQLTLEMIRNDDVGAVQRIPTKLIRSARRTLSKFVLDFIKDNPLIYDGVALFHATHGNLGAAALDKTTLAAGRLAMLTQTEKDSGDRLGIGPKSLLVPPDLEETGVDLFRRNTENDRTFVQSLSLDVLPVWYWTDANDWALAADPMDIPTIEIGFLDGQEEPDLFVQDSPTVGSLFSHDQITYKLRHIYGGTVIDYRGLYKAVVA